MQLWPVLLWPKPKARQRIQHYRNRNINLQFATRTFSTPAATATLTFHYALIINTLLLITTTWGLTTTQQQQQQPTGNYEGANAVAEAADVVAALTGLTNGYASSDYIKNYYHVSEAAETTEQQQQQQQLHQQNNAIAVRSGQQGDAVGAAGIIGRGFMGLQSNNYGNSIVARGVTTGEVVGRGLAHEDTFSVYDGGFVPTTFTAAGQHYAASLGGRQSATDKNNVLHHYATAAAYKNNLHANHQPYGNSNSNSNYNSNNNFIAEAGNNKHNNMAQKTLFRRLSNYDGLDNVNGVTTGDASIADDDGGESEGETIAGNGGEGLMEKYAVTYEDKAQQIPVLRNFYNQQTTFNNDQQEREKTFANYFPPSMTATATVGYEIENPQKYYTLNNYRETTKPQQKQQYIQYQQKLPAYASQQQQQTITTMPAPATYYQTFIQHKNDNQEHHNHQQHYRHVAGDNYHTWKQNQIMANYQPKQSTTIEKQQPHKQQTQQKHLQSNNNQYQHSSIQEPETAETSQSTRIKKPLKHKSKRHDAQEQAYNYDALLENNDIETERDDISAIQLQQLQHLQHQLHQQQQQFVDLQHQLIDHDQQLQIQKQIAQSPPPALPPITHTVHHNPHSLQALTGTPISQHTQVIKAIPIPQHQQIHIPYRENVTIEVPDTMITAINKPVPIEIPLTRTVTIPKIQEVKIPIQKLKPFPVERPIPYIVEKRVPYPVEKQIAKPVYYPVPIKVPIVHTVVHKVHQPAYGNYQQHGNYHQPHNTHQQSYHLPHTVYRHSHGHGSGHGHGHSYSHSHHY
ncbi:hypothetical protein FF38_12624 [Lucilia cuprina]|uniref:Uncharacterized protein n=1 Tax=Lucilia cuprina TaxID=7375 RepID=A0A0L0BMY4_LUCCU|nr:hypothetical protein CVS40_0118 [Lucilia cuprina]KNC21465.1 hypothetical protein FF38_12624 [Lucilia cuprina]